MQRATETFAHPDGMTAEGDELDDDSPIVKGREQFFERASARPGEKRSVKRPATKKVAKKPAAKKATK